MPKKQVPVREPNSRFDPFRFLTAEERDRHRNAYRTYLELRNGEIDYAGRRLSRRESYFRALEASPVVSSRAYDRRGFDEHLKGPGKTSIDDVTAWLAAVAKANEGEVYGTDLELRRFFREKRFLAEEGSIEGDTDGTDLVQLYVFFEELYHSRILSVVCDVCGLDLEIQPPRWRIRILSRLIYHMPDSIRWTVILCAEVVGATVFKLFLDRCDLFSEESAVEARIRSLVSEIWRDELLHVAMLRARLGRTSIWIARRIFPLVVGSLIRDVPELLQLGGNRGEFMRRVRQGVEIPDDIGWIEADSAPTA